MAGFSIGEAVGEGFGLIKRRPLSVFIWGLLTVLPAAAAMGFMLPMMEAFTGSMVEAAAEGEAASGAMPDSMMASMMQMQAILAPVERPPLRAGRDRLHGHRSRHRAPRG